MTTQQPEALRLANVCSNLTPYSMEDHLIAAELRSQHAENEALRAERDRNLNSIRVNNEIINKKNAELESLRTGYAAARLEIESLQARIKAMAEEHADELMVAHLDGRMRAAQPAGEYPALPKFNTGAVATEESGKVEMYPAAFKQLLKEIFDRGAREAASAWLAYVEADRAMRAAQPARAQQPGDERAAFEQWSKVTNQGYDLARNVSGKLQTFESTETEHAWRGFFHGLRASHGQAPAQAAPAAVHSDLRARCVEVLAWRKTGTLPGEALRTLAREKYGDRYDALRRAERDTVTEALNLVAAAPTTQAAPASQGDALQPVVALQEKAGMYADDFAPQADSVTAPAAGAVAHTLSDAQIEAMPVWRNFVGLWPESRREIVDAVVDLLAAAPTPPAQAADSVLEDAARYRYLRDGDWREHEELESVIRLQFNTLWDAKIDAARKEMP